MGDALCPPGLSRRRGRAGDLGSSIEPLAPLGASAQLSGDAAGGRFELKNTMKMHEHA